MATNTDALLDALLAPIALDSPPQPKVVMVNQGPKPMFPRKYALYMSNGVQCSGHYDDGTPMPLTVRVEMFLSEFQIASEHNLLIIGLLRSLVSRKDKFLKALQVTPAKSAVMEKFYKNSHFFGIPSPTATEARRFVICEDDIEKILSPKYLTTTATKPKNELMHDLSYLVPQLEHDLGEGFLPNEVVFGPVEIYTDMRENIPAKLPETLKASSVKKDTPVKLEEESQPITHGEVEDVRKHYYRSEDAPEQVNQNDVIHDEFYNIMGCRPTEIKFKLGLKQDLVFKTRPENGRYLLRTKLVGRSLPKRKVQRGVVIYAPPGHGKSTLIKSYGLSGNLIDTDFLGRIDAMDMQTLLNAGYSLITNRSDCLPFLDAEILSFCHTDKDTTYQTILVKTERRLDVVRQWTHDIHKEILKAENVIWLKPDEHIGDHWHEIRQFAITRRFHGRIKKTRRRYVVV